MLAARLDAPGTLTLADLPAPVAREGQALVRVDACGICGSDLHAFRTSFAAQSGRVLGHEICGTVVAAPGVAGVRAGERVAIRPQWPCGVCAECRDGREHLCETGAANIVGYGTDGGFAELVLIPHARLDETLFLLDPGVDDRAGALVEPLAVGLRAVGQAGEGVAGGTVLVLGAGMIGLAVTQFLRRAGAGAIIVADPSARRRAAALALGADVVVDPTERLAPGERSSPTVVAVRSLTGPGARGTGARADVVIDCAGVPAALADGLRAVRAAGTVVFCAIYAQSVPLRPDTIVAKELIVRGSFAYAAEFRAVVELLRAGAIDPALYVSHELPLERIAEAFGTQADPHASLKVLVRPGGRGGPNHEEER
jgi:2-desacetyl-2-hydroxyethyl bacteriochlorophyllide A dehydrogenase